MGSYGNIVSLIKTEDLYKIRKCIIDNGFHWVIIAIQSNNLQIIYIK